jgi:predicted protein tyrosine phosphatase
VGSNGEARCSTAARLFATEPDVVVDYAWMGRGADRPVDETRLGWADVIFVLDRGGERRLRRRHPDLLARKRVVDLDLPRDAGPLDLRLMEMLRCRVRPHLQRP